MAGRNEAELPAELAQSGGRQTFDQRLAVVARRAFGHDEKMMRRPDSVLERLVPDDLDGVGPDSVPCRDVTTCDVRWGNSNDGGNHAGGANSQFAHTRSPDRDDPVSLLERRVL